MLVKDIMTEPVVTIREDQSILEAREIMTWQKTYQPAGRR